MNKKQLNETLKDILCKEGVSLSRRKIYRSSINEENNMTAKPETLRKIAKPLMDSVYSIVSQGDRVADSFIQELDNVINALSSMKEKLNK